MQEVCPDLVCPLAHRNCARSSRSRAGVRQCSPSAVRSAADGVSSQRTHGATVGKFDHQPPTSLNAPDRSCSQNSPQCAQQADAPSQLLLLALAASQAIPITGYFPTSREFWPANDVSRLGDAPFWQSTVETFPTEQTSHECCSEERLSAAWTFPICETGRKKEVSNESWGKEKSRHNKGESDFEHRSQEYPEHDPAHAAITGPRMRVIGVYRDRTRFV